MAADLLVALEPLFADVRTALERVPDRLRHSDLDIAQDLVRIAIVRLTQASDLLQAARDT
jgi:hypothetical protein